jgi:hypothetical protein
MSNQIWFERKGDREREKERERKKERERERLFLGH